MSKIILNELAVPPSTPAIGKAAVTVTNTDTIRLTNDQGQSFEFGASTVFGTNFQETSKQTTETNGEDVYSTYLTLNIPTAVIGAKYRIGIAVAWGMNTGSRNIQIQLSHNNTVLGLLEMEATDTGSDIRNWNTCFFYATEDTAGPHTIEVAYRPEDDDDTATIYYAGIEKWRVE